MPNLPAPVCRVIRELSLKHNYACLEHYVLAHKAAILKCTYQKTMKDAGVLLTGAAYDE